MRSSNASVPALCVRRSIRPGQLAFVAGAALSLVSSVQAQTSGNIATQTGSSWTTAPWAITAGAGTFPDGGGVATWNPVIAATPGTVGAGATLTLNQPVTLSSIVYASPFSMTLAGTAANTLVLPATGGTIDAQLSIANTPTLFQLANNTTAPISGGGSAGLTKTGAFTATIGASAASTYTGGTHLNGGILVISTTAAIGDSVLGASGAGNGLSFNGGSLFNNITGGWTTSRDIFLDVGGGTMFANTAATLNGVISGPGSFTPQGFAAVAYTLTNTNTYTGATTNSLSAVSNLTLSGNGSIATSSSYDLAGTLALSNAATNVNDRLSNTAGMTMRGLTMTMAGNAAAATSETIGAVTLANGVNIITVTPNAAQAANIDAASFTRQDNASLFIRGTSLGAASAAGVAQVTSTVAPSLSGGGGAAGSTTISIIPWAAGNTSATATLGSSLMTYGATGFRPLAAAEYSPTLGANATDNVRLTAATVAGSGVTANALVFAPAAAANLSGGPITLTSGAFLYSPTVSSTGTVSAGLDFGTAEGVVSTTNTLNISGAIAGSGGVTINPIAGSTVTLTGANTYTGPTTLLSGVTQYSGTVTNDGTPSAFGAGTSALSPIVMNAGTATTRLWATDVSTINRDIIVRGAGPGVVDLGTSGTTYIVTVNGNINMQHNLSLDAGTTATAAMVVNGVISGPAILTDLSSSFNVLNGNNTYTGGTNIQTGTYAAGSDTAFGTGTIWFSGAGKMQSSDATAHTIANNIFTSANPTFQGTGALNFTGGVNLNGARSFGITNTAATTLSGVVSNGALTKTGAGTLALNSITGNTYTGGTLLGANAGTLNVNNTSGSGTGSGAVQIGTGSTLSGNFIIAGSTVINGTLSPGNSAGSAYFLGGLTDGTAAITSMELAGASSADFISVLGLLTLDGTVTVTTTGGYIAQPGQVFDLMDWGTINSAGFTVATDLVLAGAAVAPGEAWDTSTFLIDGQIRVTPAPTSALLVAFGGIGVLGRRRHR